MPSLGSSSSRAFILCRPGLLLLLPSAWETSTPNGTGIVSLTTISRSIPISKPFMKKCSGPTSSIRTLPRSSRRNSSIPTDVFQRSGAKYVVLTSNDHEGFTLWPSAQSWNRNSVDIGPHRDLCGDLTRSVKAKDLHMGLYYSLYE